MPPPVNHPLWTAVTKSVAPTPIAIHTAPTPVAQVAQLQARSVVQRFIDAAKGNTLIKPKLVQDPNDDIWRKHLPSSPQHIEVRATTTEDLEACEREAVVANIVGQTDRRGGRHQRKLTETFKDSVLQRRHAKRDSNNHGFESVPCSDPRVSSEWYCKGLGPPDLSVGAALAAKRDSEAVFQWSKYQVSDAEKDAIIKQAKAYIAYVKETGTEDELDNAKDNAVAMASVSQARERILWCKEDLAKAGKIIRTQRIGVILLSVLLCVIFCGGLVKMLLELHSRSKKRAQERAEERVVELQVRAGGANGEEAK